MKLNEKSWMGGRGRGGKGFHKVIVNTLESTYMLY